MAGRSWWSRLTGNTRWIWENALERARQHAFVLLIAAALLVALVLLLGPYRTAVQWGTVGEWSSLLAVVVPSALWWVERKERIRAQSKLREREALQLVDGVRLENAGVGDRADVLRVSPGSASRLHLYKVVNESKAPIRVESVRASHVDPDYVQPVSPHQEAHPYELFQALGSDYLTPGESRVYWYAEGAHSPSTQSITPAVDDDPELWFWDVTSIQWIVRLNSSPMALFGNDWGDRS
ncbi:hypothetical protein ACH436_19410 [Isoptericola sp. NPDC019693]|uniref:hypothetical protein n=1 Tax=Isoptericola sp. NPDC019693 TaxID=3364009 RepID=UPI0037A2CE86